MLITNFASGELSETLFGRTDLPQYYQGVSRLENFDVIPSGGITRRNGTKRLAAMEREGRIIPFIVDRENQFLVVISPGNIRILQEDTPVFDISDRIYEPEPGAETDNAFTRKVNGWLIRGCGIKEKGAGYVDGDQAVYTLRKPDGEIETQAYFTVSAPHPVTGVTVDSQDFFTRSLPDTIWLPGKTGRGLVIEPESRLDGYKVVSVQIENAGSDYQAGDTVYYQAAGGRLACTVREVNADGEVTGIDITGQEYFQTDIAGTLAMSGGSGAGLALEAATRKLYRIAGIAVNNQGKGYKDGEEITWQDADGSAAVLVLQVDTGAQAVSLDGTPVFETQPKDLTLDSLSGNGQGLTLEVETVREQSSILQDITPVAGMVARVREDETGGNKSQLYRYDGDSRDWVKVYDTVLYRTMKDINEIQYVQTYNSMVLAHRMYRPAIIRMGFTADDEGGRVRTFSLDYIYLNTLMNTRISGGAEVTAQGKNDDSVTAGFLETPGNYPGCVAWFSGRLVFAGTEKERQRIWASGVVENNVFNFSTKTRFITAGEEVLAVGGDAAPGEYRITGVKPEVMGQLAAMGNGLKIKPGIFRDNIAGDPNIVGLGDVDDENVIRVDQPVPYSVGISEPELKKLQEWLLDANNALYAKYVILAGEDSGWDGTSYTSTDYKLHYTAYSAIIEKIVIERNTFPWLSTDETTSWLGPLPSEDTAALISLIYILTGGHARIGVIQAVWNHITSLKNIWEKKSFRGGEYRGTPQKIYDQILGKYPPVEDSYFLVYKETVLEEEYPVASDGFTFEIASDMSDAIKWIGQNKNLLIGTETAEWVIPAGVSATNVQAVLNSRYGSDRIQGTSIGDAFCFFQTGGKALVEYYIPQQDNNFRANNMAMLSPNMLHESPAFDFDFVSAPYTRIFVSRDDGIVVSLLYERSTGTFAWGRIITDGFVRSVATLPGPEGYDEAYLVVERGGGAFFLERLDERKWDEGDPSARYYLDSNRPWTGSQADWDDYDNNAAAVWDETDGKSYPLNAAAVPPVPGDFSPAHRMYIGYPFVSRVKSMPVLANDRMRQNNIKALKVRFRDSCMPRVRAEPNGVENTIPHRGKPGEGFSGILNVPFPGVYERDVFFEFVFSDPRRCEILAVNAEVN
jgi:hypothetical protein